MQLISSDTFQAVRLPVTQKGIKNNLKKTDDYYNSLDLCERPFPSFCNLSHLLKLIIFCETKLKSADKFR